MDKKVLLRERKRHTARRVVSTPSAVWVPPPDLAGGGYPTLVPPSRVPPWLDLAGYPPSRVLPPAGPGRVPPGWTWQGTPPAGHPPPQLDLAGYPPGWTWQGTPPRCMPHGILGNVAKYYGIWVPPLWDRQKDRHVSKHYLPVVLRKRAVKIVMYI